MYFYIRETPKHLLHLQSARLFNLFPFSCPTPMLSGPCWVSSVGYHSLQCCQKNLCAFILPGCVLCCFPIIIVVPRVSKYISVHCSKAPLAAVRLLESECRHFSKFKFLGFLPSTADASLDPRRGSVHLVLGIFFPEVFSSRSAVFRLNRLTCGPM